MPARRRELSGAKLETELGLCIEQDAELLAFPCRLPLWVGTDERCGKSVAERVEVAFALNERADRVTAGDDKSRLLHSMQRQEELAGNRFISTLAQSLYHHLWHVSQQMPS